VKSIARLKVNEGFISEPSTSVATQLFNQYWDGRSFGAKQEMKSSHWQEYLNQSQITLRNDGSYQIAIKGLAGLTSRTVFNYLKYPLMWIQLMYLSFKFRLSIKSLSLMFRISKKSNKLWDYDLLRQMLSTMVMKSHISGVAPKVVIIGDGFGMMGQIIKSIFPDSKVYFVNLGENLFLDALFTGLVFPEPYYSHSIGDLYSENASTDFTYIAAGDQKAIADIDAFINIASMGEMDPESVNQYFQWIKKCAAPSAIFYCCNRELKLLPDGTVSSFAQYPFDLLGGEVLLDELCPWYQKWPTGKIPFWRKFDGPVRHKIVSFQGNL